MLTRLLKSAATICVIGAATVLAGSLAIAGPTIAWARVRALLGHANPPSILAVVALGPGYPSGTVLITVKNPDQRRATVSAFELIETRRALPHGGPSDLDQAAAKRSTLCALAAGRHALDEPASFPPAAVSHLVIRTWDGVGDCGFKIRLIGDRGGSAPQPVRIADFPGGAPTH